MNPRRELGLQLAGWLLFLACALVYLLAGIRSGDMLIIIGSLLFLVACLLFLWPLLVRLRMAGRHDRGGI